MCISKHQLQKLKWAEIVFPSTAISGEVIFEVSCSYHSFRCRENFPSFWWKLQPTCDIFGENRFCCSQTRQCFTYFWRRMRKTQRRIYLWSKRTCCFLNPIWIFPTASAFFVQTHNNTNIRINPNELETKEKRERKHAEVNKEGRSEDESSTLSSWTSFRVQNLRYFLWNWT